MKAETEALVARALAGERLALARLLSLVEDDPVEGPATVARLYPHTGRAQVIGVTGAPGTGKSTLVAEMAREYRRRGATVAIVAVDPSSPFTGGALLGDRIRMAALSGDRGVFIRSMASRGSLGGLAWATWDAVQVLDACGWERVLVETVGAGQTEVEIARAAHTTVVLQVPGTGDEIQTLKAGLLEIADILVVNKADLEGAARTTAALEALLALGADPLAPPGAGWCPPVLKTVAARGEGVAPVVDAVERHMAYLRQSGRIARQEREWAARELDEALHRELRARMLARLGIESIERMVRRVQAREIDPTAAARELLGDG